MCNNMTMWQGSILVMINFVTYTFTPVVVEVGKGLQISVEKLAQQIE